MLRMMVSSPLSMPTSTWWQPAAFINCAISSEKQSPRMKAIQVTSTFSAIMSLQNSITFCFATVKVSS